MHVERVKVWFTPYVTGHLHWAVTGGFPSTNDPQHRRTWHVQPAGRTRHGTTYGHSVATFFRRKDAAEFAKQLRAEGEPTYAMVERREA